MFDFGEVEGKGRLEVELEGRLVELEVELGGRLEVELEGRLEVELKVEGRLEVELKVEGRLEGEEGRELEGGGKERKCWWKRERGMGETSLEEVLRRVWKVCWKRE